MQTPRSATASKVAAAVEAAGLSRRHLSEATGIPYTTLYRKLNGHSPYTLDEIASIASAVCVHPAELVSFPRPEDEAVA